MLDELSLETREEAVTKPGSGELPDSRVSADIPLRFDLRSYRLQMIVRFRSEFEASPKGGDPEWESAYRLMFQSMLAQQDSLGRYVDGKGEPIRAKAEDNINEFKSFSDGRMYEWTRAEYPVLAELTTRRLNKATERVIEIAPLASDGPNWPPLTDEQREAIDVLYAAALAELEHSPR
ncbi:MAG: hypothetical protein SGI72_05870 [Planctomycetota bacterium]|nr:hypothetical protein [Planctomycetota bacterium]